jgi:hypothetical protein
MTIHGWLSTHEAGSPEPLRQSVRDALGDDVECAVGEAPQRFIEASERVLRKVLRSDAASRETAFELLTADALLTYAFQVATEAGGSLEDAATEAVRRINALDAEITDGETNL